MQNIGSLIQGLQTRIIETGFSRGTAEIVSSKTSPPDGLPERFRSSTLAKYNIERQGQQQAVGICADFIETWRKHGGLILVGAPGTGKTMLGCAMLNAIAKQGTLILRYVTQMQAMRLIKSTWGGYIDLSEDQAIRKLTRPDVLVMDEVGLKFGTDTERGLFTEVCNERYNTGRPTILISNLPLSELSCIIGERVTDRFRQGGRMVPFDWESYRTKAPWNEEST